MPEERLEEHCRKYGGVYDILLGGDQVCMYLETHKHGVLCYLSLDFAIPKH